MHRSSLLEAVVVVVVVVVVGVVPPAAAETRTYGSGPPVGWPHSGPPLYQGPYSAPSHLSVLFPRVVPPHRVHHTYPDYVDYSEPSHQASPLDDLTLRIVEAQRRYEEDFLLLRRLLQEQHYLLKGTPLDIPQVRPPVFRLPLFPGYGTEEEEEEEEHAPSDGLPDEGDHETDYEHEDDGTNIFLDSPVPGPEWAIIPYLPEVPDADDLPDNYNNETHAIHIVNGSRVEVNTTTNKETGDSITTFFHTEVINILPDEDPKEKELEEAATEEPTPFTTKPEEEEVPTTQPEEPPAEEDTINEVPPFNFPIPSAELIAEETRLQRNAPNPPTTTTSSSSRPVALRSAAYASHPRGALVKGKGQKGKDVKPKDLSGDTLVNQLSRGTKEGKTEEPDAEVLL
ncbi:uncharacterized protein LOC123501237 isoform X2 [Portunus trituberculatus]|uniref:uncharacterized protein LOC123501237 isoform X2 n=1 Tax=Portunus trituberculatus TaxID=210409 RepID=UPI001E1CE92A|nr:uncharacterized protein LOC123501237 isoform X2 [Portunus trituberculatus]